MAAISKWRLRIAWLLFSVALVGFYWWTATSSKDPLGSPDENSTSGTGHYYHLMTNAFLAGHLHLLIQPSPKLLALKNPWDPEQNAAFRLHDASLHKGKYYFYYGVTPVITLFLPWKVVTGSAIPQNVAAVVFLSAGYAFSCLLLLLLLRAAEIETSILTKGVLIATLGLGQMAPMIARRSVAVYEIPITAGFCFLAGAAYFLARRMLAPESKPWLAIISGVMLGLTPGCRPHYALAVALLLAVYIAYLRPTRGLGKGFVRELAYFAIPLAVCAICLGWYNFARFGNPLHFGTEEQLSGNAAIQVRPDLRNLVSGLYYYLFSTPIWTSQFPFLHLAKQGAAPFGHPEWVPRDYFRNELMAGFLSIAPMCFLGCLIPILVLCKKQWTTTPVRLLILGLWFSALSAFVSVCLVVNYISMRYTLDFAPSLLLVSLFTVLLAAARFKARIAARFMTALVVIACVWSTVSNAALSINGYDNGLKLRNPTAFKVILSFFGGDPNAILYSILSLDVDLNVAFAAVHNNDREALLTTGTPGAADYIFLEHAAPDRLRVGYEHSGKSAIFGPEVSIVPGKASRLLIRYTRDPKNDLLLALELDGQVVFQHPAAPYFTSAKGISVGTDPIDSPLRLRPFAGRVAVKNISFKVDG